MVTTRFVSLLSWYKIRNNRQRWSPQCAIKKSTAPLRHGKFHYLRLSRIVVHICLHFVGEKILISLCVPKVKCFGLLLKFKTCSVFVPYTSDLDFYFVNTLPSNFNPLVIGVDFHLKFFIRSFANP